MVDLKDVCNALEGARIRFVLKMQPVHATLDESNKGKKRIMSASWAVTPEKVEAVIQRIVDRYHPVRLILFGSYVTGETGPNSDLDILVVTGDEVASTRRESVRLRRALRGISMPMDILVVPESRLKQLAQVSGLVYREALRHGEVVYESGQ